MVGYSNTPLVRTLGLKESDKIYVKNAPKNYLELISPIPTGTLILKRLSNNIDIIHLFSKDKDELNTLLETYADKIKQTGMIWVSWPKQSSEIPTNISEEVVRAAALERGLVDINICTVDENWSALKLVLRKEHRAA